LIAAAGCRESPESKMERAYRDNPQVTRPQVARVAGKVTIGGKTPAELGLGRVFVLLTDPKKPPKDPNRPINTPCAPDGSFVFTTFATGDGIQVGSYVVTFVRLSRNFGKRGSGYLGPDLLNNRYNDPEVNGKKPEFVIEVKPPGKTDYVFDLTVEGAEPVHTPGPGACTQLP
jgi:hypothetical protein